MAATSGDGSRVPPGGDESHPGTDRGARETGPPVACSRALPAGDMSHHEADSTAKEPGTPGEKLPAGRDRSTFGDAVQKTLQQELPAKNPNAVDIVFCLDTSSSMQLLIDDARNELWKVAHEVKRQKPDAVLRIALICYGTPFYDEKKGWVDVMSDFTENIEVIEALLSHVRAYGGDEYVARALSEALQLKKWNNDSRTLRLIFIAGNESVNQDPDLDLAKVCDAARYNNIIVNAIYCGTFEHTIEQGISDGWDALASNGGGKYYSIDISRADTALNH
jgi:Mg-chelatase subunit ChlD